MRHTSKRYRFQLHCLYSPRANPYCTHYFLSFTWHLQVFPAPVLLIFVGSIDKQQQHFCRADGCLSFVPLLAIAAALGEKQCRRYQASSGRPFSSSGRDFFTPNPLALEVLLAASLLVVVTPGRQIQTGPLIVATPGPTPRPELLTDLLIAAALRG